MVVTGRIEHLYYLHPANMRETHDLDTGVTPATGRPPGGRRGSFVPAGLKQRETGTQERRKRQMEGREGRGGRPGGEKGEGE